MIMINFLRKKENGKDFCTH